MNRKSEGSISSTYSSHGFVGERGLAIVGEQGLTIVVSDDNSSALLSTGSSLARTRSSPFSLLVVAA